MSKFTKPTIKWAELEKLVPKDQKNRYLTFKAKSDGYLRRMLSSPPQPPKINWQEYQKVVPVPGLVDKFKSQYESLKIPYPEDTMSKQIDAQWSQLQGQISTFVAEMQKEIDTANKEISRIASLPKFEDMTMEDFYDLYPNLALDPVNKPTFWPHDEEENKPDPKSDWFK